MKTVLTKFEVVDSKALWICQIEGCGHTTTFLTVAIFHQNVEHSLPMEGIKVDEENTQLTWEKGA